MSLIAEALNGPLAVLLWARDEHGEDDVAILVGPLREDAGILFVDRDPEPPFELNPDWIPRISRTAPDLLDIVGGAPFMLSLTVGSTDEVRDDDRPTGLKWPEGPAPR